MSPDGVVSDWSVGLAIHLPALCHGSLSHLRHPLRKLCPAMCLMLIQERSENCHVYMVRDLRYILGEHPALNHQ